MTVKGTGSARFFMIAAQILNGVLKIFLLNGLAAIKIAQIGYILLLDGMDAEDAEYGTVMAKAFARFQKMGLKTAATVSENSDRFARLVIPALKYVDYLILNEFALARLSD